MINLIDTHAHVYLPEFEGDIHNVLNESKKADIIKIYMPNIDNSTIENMLALEERYTNYCIPMMGLHPCYVKDNYKDELKTIEAWFQKRKFCAVGEIGIDLYWDKTYINEQISVFETQINWAKDYGLPVIIHCRDSLDLTIEIIQKNQDGRLKGIFHCFTGSTDQAIKIIDLNFLLGIGGVVTFKNGGLDKVIPNIKLNNIVLETDSPYLAPVPYRGKRNTPAYLHHIASHISDLMQSKIADVAIQTTENANKLFNHD